MSDAETVDGGVSADAQPDTLAHADGTADDPPAPDAPSASASASASASDRDAGMLASLVVAVVAGAALVITAQVGAAPLLVAVAAVQAFLTVAWVFGTQQPGRIGALVIAALAAAGTDVAVSVFPHGRLGACVAVLGLALPVMFVHQLARGVARVHLVNSLSGIALLTFSVVALPALLQLRHELETPTQAGRVVAAAVGAIAAALVVGFLVDLVLPVPRFDPSVPRGLPAVVVSAAVGAAFAFFMLRGDADGSEFTDGRAAFIGVALGALAALLSVGATFLVASLDGRAAAQPMPAVRLVLCRAVVALLPLCLLAPVTFLLCLAVRS